MKISVDFCSGPCGPFLAINKLVVAGSIDESGKGVAGVVVQSFEITGEALLASLRDRGVKNEQSL